MKVGAKSCGIPEISSAVAVGCLLEALDGFDASALSDARVILECFMKESSPVTGDIITDTCKSLKTVPARLQDIKSMICQDPDRARSHRVTVVHPTGTNGSNVMVGEGGKSPPPALPLPRTGSPRFATPPARSNGQTNVGAVTTVSFKPMHAAHSGILLESQMLASVSSESPVDGAGIIAGRRFPISSLLDRIGVSPGAPSNAPLSQQLVVLPPAHSHVSFGEKRPSPPILSPLSPVCSVGTEITERSAGLDCSDGPFPSRASPAPPQIQACTDKQTSMSAPKDKAGIGLLLMWTKNDVCQVKDLLRGGPADEDGTVNIGDQVLAIDGMTVDGLDYRQIIDLILGPEGSWVEVALYRGPRDESSSLSPALTGQANVHAHLMRRKSGESP